MAPERPVMDGYIRVSQVGGRSGDRFQSPDTQRDAITGWAKAHGIRIGQIHEDLDRSGGTMERPGMTEARRRIDAGESTGIIVARLDRFARTVVGGLTTIHELHDRGARVVSVAENLDPATPMGRAMLGLLLIMAEWQRDQADEHLAAAMSKANAAGRFVIRTPYGYRRTAEGRVEPDPVTSKVVARIYRMRADGAGWRKIADVLTDDGLPTPSGGKRWAHNTISGIVQSKSSLGVFTGPRGGSDPEAWPAIITRELWDAANAVQGVRDNDRRHHDRLLAGIARCAECRSVLTRGVNPHGYVSYACSRPGCRVRPSIGAKLLDEHVAEVVDARLRRVALEYAPAEDAGLGPLLAARNAAVSELEQWRDDLTLRQVLGNDDYRAGLIERARARDAAEQALASYRSEAGAGVVRDVPGGAAFRLANLEWDRQRRVAEAYLHSVWVRKGTVRGPGARRHVGFRVRVVWMDDRDRPDLPRPSSPARGPVPWPA